MDLMALHSTPLLLKAWSCFFPPRLFQ
uniref:Uncharacterized protein n=1 Tax=Anguilla anguilla TaxID=7936 RepID=A0A0E9QTG5_ANGAN